MTSLINNEGREITQQSEIKTEVNNFYKNLYTSKEHLIEDVNLEEKLCESTPKLTEDQAFSIEGLISFSEALSTLKKMQNNKSPGSTGFTTEFFKFFWNDIGHFVVNSINHSFETGEFCFQMGKQNGNF